MSTRPATSISPLRPSLGRRWFAQAPADPAPLDASVVLDRLRNSRNREDALVYALAVSALDSCEAVNIYFEGSAVCWWHEGYARPFGYSQPGEFAPFDDAWWREKIHPEDRKRMAKIADDFLTNEHEKGKAQHASRFRWRRADGAYSLVSCHTTSVFAESGERLASVTTYRDLTEEIAARTAMETELEYRRQTEKGLRRESKLRASAERIVRKQAEASANTLKLLLRNPHPHEIVRAMLRTIALECGGIWSTLWKIDEATGEVERAGIFHRDEQLARRVERFARVQAAPLKSLAGIYLELAERHRCTFVVAATDERVPARIQKFYAEIGVHTALVVPLLLGSRLLGWISLLLPQSADRVHPDVVAFVEMTGNHAVLATYLQELGNAARDTALARENERLAREREKEASWVSRLLCGQEAESPSADGGVEELLSGVLGNITKLLEGDAARLWKVAGAPGALVPGGEIAPGPGDGALSLSDARPGGGGPDDPEIHIETRPEGCLVHIPLRFQREFHGIILVATAKNFPPTSERWLAVKALGIQAAQALRLDALSKVQRTAVLAQERNRLARDMHDMLAQGFSGISLQVEAMRAECPEMSAGVADRLEKIRVHAGRSVEEVRRSIQMLRPVLLDGHRFPAALAALAQEVQSATGIRTAAELPEESPALSSKTEIHLFAIATEAVQNAVRHSGGQTITLSLSRSRGRVMLAIEDDGQGLAPGTRPRAGHFGLLNMQERAVAVRGRIAFKTRPEGGLRVEISVREEKPAAAARAVSQ